MIHKIVMSFISAILLSVMLGCGGGSSGGDSDSTSSTDSSGDTPESSVDTASSSYQVTDLLDGRFKIDFTIANSATSTIYYSFSKQDVTSSNYMSIALDAVNGDYSYTASETTTLTCTKDTTTSFICSDLADADVIMLTPGSGIHLFKGTTTNVTQRSFENRLVTITMDSATGSVADDSNTTNDDSNSTVDDSNTTVNLDDTNNTSEVKYIVKKTGQTKSFNDNGDEVTDSSLKDDGYHQTGVEARYTRASDMVTDELTGLMWQDEKWINTQEEQDDDIYFEDRNWTKAEEKCANLTLGGYTNWKLPTKKELQNIIDYSRERDSISSEFNNTNEYGYWTSSIYQSDNTQAWVVGFYYGRTTVGDKSDNNYVRCARNQE